MVATEAVKEAAVGDYRWSYAGRHRFKGVYDDVAVYRVRNATLPDS